MGRETLDWRTLKLPSADRGKSRYALLVSEWGQIGNLVGALHPLPMRRPTELHGARAYKLANSLVLDSYQLDAYLLT